MLSGCRLVDIEHFMKQIMELGKHGSKCTMGRYALIKEVQNGVAFKLYFKCNGCNRHQVVTSEKEQCLADSVNNAFVWGALSIGIGHRQAKDLLAVMDCPSPSFKKFKRHEVLIGKVNKLYLRKKVSIIQTPKVVMIYATFINLTI